MSTLPTTSFPKGHPISIYFQENDLINQLLRELHATNPEAEYQKFYNIFNHLTTIEKRFVRKENQLFPYLEKYGWNGPSKGMWSFHDSLREQIRLLSGYVASRNYEKIKVNLEFLIGGIYRLMETEETVLFPNAMELLQEQDWITMRAGEEEIGWMLSEVPAVYPEKDSIPTSPEVASQALPFDTENALHLEEGYMTVAQINLLFKTMPFDITYVDENDKVVYYNRGEERVFPRSAGIIGREVRFCHPPKSVDTVLKILEEFKSGAKSEASFWINYKGQLIYIRYFAVRDASQNYKGVIEISQDITAIKEIDGEKRLLDWK
jgi:PAS domain S-box-containing protein